VHQFQPGPASPECQKVGGETFAGIDVFLTADGPEILAIELAHRFQVIHPDGYMVYGHGRVALSEFGKIVAVFDIVTKFSAFTALQEWIQKQ